MIEWCARMRARGWLAGFVESGHQDIARVTEGQTPRVLVVDYPEGRVAEVVALCRRAHAALAPIRIVLLARSRGPWFEDLRQEVDGGMVSRARWIELGKLDDVQRRHTYEEARAVFSHEFEPSDAISEDLTRDELPLFAHMRALLRARGEQQSDEPPEQVLARVLVHERKHWLPLAEQRQSQANLMRRRFDRVLTAIVLFGGVDLPLGPLLRWLAPKLDDDERELFATQIAALYRNADRVVSLQPDLLGEQLVFESFIRAESDGAPGIEWWLKLVEDERAPKGSVGRTLTVLTRLVDRNIEPAHGWLRSFLAPRCQVWMRACIDQRDQADPRGHELAAAVRSLDDVEVARLLEPELPESTVELLQLRVDVIQLILNHTLQDAESQPERARLSGRLGTYLADAGRREEALVATQVAVEILRGLVTAGQDTLVSHLASTLNNLGNHLSETGQRQEALEASQEAVAHYRTLTENRSHAHLPGLALSLNNLGNRLLEMGLRKEAVNASRESVEHYRKLAEANRDIFLPHLASALNNMGTHLSEFGQREKGLRATREAVKHYRELADERPDAFLHDLAMALNNLGVDLESLDQEEEALPLAQEAVTHCRELAKSRPDAFLPTLARSLDTLGCIQRALGQAHKSAASLSEAMRILLPYHTNFRSTYKRLFDDITKELRTTCETAKIEVPIDLRPWTNGKMTEPDDNQ